jgi:hypothetical protein
MGEKRKVLVDSFDGDDLALALCGLKAIFDAIRLVEEEDDKFGREAQQSLIDNLAMAGGLMCDQISDRT